MSDFAVFERVLHALPDGRRNVDATKEWLEKADPEDKPDCLSIAWTLFAVPDLSQELADLREFRAGDVIKMGELSRRLAKPDGSPDPLKKELKAVSDRIGWLDGEIAKIGGVLDAWPPVQPDRWWALTRKYGLPGFTPTLPTLPKIPTAEPQAQVTNPFASFERAHEIAAKRMQSGAPATGPRPPRERYFRKLLGEEAGKAYARVASELIFYPAGRDYLDRLLQWLKGIEPSHRHAALAVSELCRQLDELRRGEAAIRKAIRKREKIIDDRKTSLGLQEALTMENTQAEGLLRIILEPVGALEESILKLGPIMERYGQPPQYDPLPLPGEDSVKL